MRVHTLQRKGEKSAKQSFEVWTRLRIKAAGLDGRRPFAETSETKLSDTIRKRAIVLATASGWPVDSGTGNASECPSYSTSAA